jgi:hypothetical protein
MRGAILPSHFIFEELSLARKPNYNVEKRNRELQKKKKREDKLRSKRESQDAQRQDEARPEPTDNPEARQES